MAIYEQTYDAWDGALRSRPARAFALFASSFRLVWRSLLVKIFLTFIFAIVVLWIGILMMIASADIPPLFTLGNRIYRDRFFETVAFQQLMMLITAVCGSGLISLDRKHNAFSMYFSRAIGRADYIAAKYMVILSFLGLATFLPGLMLWIGQVTIGNEPTTFAEHFADLGAIFAHSLTISLPAGALILAFSSLSRTRYVPVILWVLLYEGTAIASGILSHALDVEWAKLLSYRNLTAHLGMMFYEWRPVRSILPFARGETAGV
ncbi:MAG: hypothetical protein ACYTAF_05385, partial [Planctomycetota bacterium]